MEKPNKEFDYEEYKRKLKTTDLNTIVGYGGKLMTLRQAKRAMKWDGFTAKLRSHFRVGGPYILGLGIIIAILVWLF